MPKAVVDAFLSIWNALKYFFRSLWTLLKFRAQEFDTRLKGKYSPTKRALIWFAIVSVSLIVIVVTLRLLADFGLSYVNFNGPRPTPVEPTPTFEPIH